MDLSDCDYDAWLFKKKGALAGYAFVSLLTMLLFFNVVVWEFASVQALCFYNAKWFIIMILWSSSPIYLLGGGE